MVFEKKQNFFKFEIQPVSDRFLAIAAVFFKNVTICRSLAKETKVF